METEHKDGNPIFCRECTKRALVYVDESTELDRHLLLISQLCAGVWDLNEMKEDVIQNIGDWLISYLHQRNLIEWYFFDRVMPEQYKDPIYRSQLAELRNRMNSQKNEGED